MRSACPPEFLVLSWVVRRIQVVLDFAGLERKFGMTCCLILRIIETEYFFGVLDAFRVGLARNDPLNVLCPIETFTRHPLRFHALSVSS